MKNSNSIAFILARKNSKRFKSKNSDEKDINIAMYNNHYFLFEKTHYSNFSIKNSII